MRIPTVVLDSPGNDTAARREPSNVEAGRKPRRALFVTLATLTANGQVEAKIVAFPAKNARRGDSIGRVGRVPHSMVEGHAREIAALDGLRTLALIRIVD